MLPIAIDMFGCNLQNLIDHCQGSFQLVDRNQSGRSMSGTSIDDDWVNNGTECVCV